ncbi:hypothetical protein KIN20_019871 [Parelaphostrongylus tenuis]|uniref:Uncharacterized protein n=1 Tax=Parelaphostrongylus tenuis TaxID=148309 RepID=A0AAD5QT63_PARTN|nr:hypothetical protein KIN20_019871 [Parelaphostrongylus tenuis]
MVSDREASTDIDSQRKWSTTLESKWYRRGSRTLGRNGPCDEGGIQLPPSSTGLTTTTDGLPDLNCDGGDILMNGKRRHTAGLHENQRLEARKDDQQLIRMAYDCELEKKAVEIAKDSCKVAATQDFALVNGSTNIAIRRKTDRSHVYAASSTPPITAVSIHSHESQLVTVIAKLNEQDS